MATCTPIASGVSKNDAHLMRCTEAASDRPRRTADLTMPFVDVSGHVMFTK